MKGAGLTQAQLSQAMRRYRDHGRRLGGDAAKITESFAEFAAANGWPPERRDAAVSIYGQVRDQGLSRHGAGIAHCGRRGDDRTS